MNIEIWAALAIGLIFYLGVEFLTARDMSRLEQHLKDIKINIKDIRGMLKNSNITVKYHVQRDKKTNKS
jgi:hypothetical protein